MYDKRIREKFSQNQPKSHRKLRASHISRCHTAHQKFTEPFDIVKGTIINATIVLLKQFCSYCTPHILSDVHIYIWDMLYSIFCTHNLNGPRSPLALRPYNFFDEIHETCYICIHSIWVSKSTKFSKRCDSDDIVHAIRLRHDNLQNRSMYYINISADVYYWMRVRDDVNFFFLPFLFALGYKRLFPGGQFS